MLPSLSLILGGARSGKTSFAESLVRADGRRPVYLATAQAFDDEMRARIAAHRDERGTGWTTIEEPMDPARALGGLTDGDAVLLDCATLWLSNLVLADRDPAPEVARLLQVAGRCPAPIVIVSNEIGMGVVPDNALARRFRDIQGRLNQDVAARADLVVAVMAGLPLTLKGVLPGAQA